MTLIEVLISMMIMAVGLALVLSLFPISVIRTAQATRMTNAAVLKFNVESRVQRMPHLVFDPDGDYAFGGGGIPELAEHVTAPENRNYIVDPIGYLAYAEDLSLVSLAGDFGNQRAVAGPAPTPLGLLPRFDGGLEVLTGLSASTGTADERRFLRQIAARLTGLGDGWDVVVDTTAVSLIPDFTGTAVAGVRLPDDVDLSDFPTSEVNTPGYSSGTIIGGDPEMSRITVFSADGAFSQSFVFTAVRGSGRDCLWTEDVNLNGIQDGLEDLNLNGVFDQRDLPAEFQNQVGRVLIQQKRTNDYNWMLTVRRNGDGWAVGVDVVVTHGRSADPDDERVFPTGPNEDANGNGVLDGGEDTNGNGILDYAFSTGSLTITVPDTAGFDGADEAYEPPLRRGGYVLDVDNARWYRIQDYERNAAAATIIVTLETLPVESSPAATGNAVFFPSVVDVFPLGSVEYPEDYPNLSLFQN